MNRQNSVVLRRGLVVTEPENDEDLQEEEDTFVPSISFFGDDHPDVDERVCNRVFAMLTKNEAPRGDYGAPFAGHVAAGYHAAITAQPPPELPEPAPPARFLPVVSAPAKTFAAPRRVEKKEETMSSEKDLTETQAAVLAAYKAGAKELGRPPSNVELQEALPPYSAYAINAARKVLVDLGLAAKPKKGGQGRRGGDDDAPAPKAKPATKTKPRASKVTITVVDGATGNGAPANEDPIIRVIREEAAKAAARSEKLNSVLNALAGAL